MFIVRIITFFGSIITKICLAGSAEGAGQIARKDYPGSVVAEVRKVG